MKPTIKKIAVYGMLTAVQVILSRFLSINITQTLKFSFGFVPLMLAAALYGIPGGCIVGFLSDILGALLFPSGPYFPGYTLASIISGAIYGYFFKVSKLGSALNIFINTLLAYLITAVIVTLGINTFCIAFQYGYLLTETHDAAAILPKFIALLPKRAIQAAIMLPLQVLISFILLTRIKHFDIK